MNLFKKVQRSQIEKKLTRLLPLQNIMPSHISWIKIIRTSLNMPQYYLAKRLKMSSAGVARLEKGEIAGTTSINTLKKAAHALDCTFVYGFIPKKPFNEMIKEQASKKAHEILEMPLHSMDLENQGLSAIQKQEHIEFMAQELIEKNSKKIWKI